MVVDQTGLPLPGVRIDVYRGADVIETVTTNADGTFQLAPGVPSDMVEAALDGFETLRVPRVEANRIVLLIGRASEVTEVVASALTSSGSAMEHLGSTMSAALAQRLPTTGRTSSSRCRCCRRSCAAATACCASAARGRTNRACGLTASM